MQCKVTHNNNEQTKREKQSQKTNEMHARDERSEVARQICIVRPRKVLAPLVYVACKTSSKSDELALTQRNVRSMSRGAYSCSLVFACYFVVEKTVTRFLVNFLPTTSKEVGEVISIIFRAPPFPFISWPFFFELATFLVSQFLVRILAD